MWNKNSTTFYHKKKQKQNKVKTKKIPKINVEHIKGNGKFYLYLYLSGT